MENTTSVPVAISGAIVNGSTAVAIILTTTITLGNVTTSVTSYNPAHHGLYGYYPHLQPLLIVILVIMTAWPLFGNGCLLYLVCAEKNMREPGNIFLCALALTDIALILVYAPTTVYSLVHGEILDESWCRIQAFFVHFLHVLSVYLQASLWICRYIHIALPFKYAAMMTKRRLAIAMTICSLIALVEPLGCVSVLSADIAKHPTIMLPLDIGGPEAVFYIGLTIVCVGVAISCIAAGLIYKVALDNEKRHQKLTGIAKDQLSRKLKAAKTLAIVTGIQLITWLPSIITTCLMKAKVIRTDTGLILGDISFIVRITSTFTDSIVYAKRKNIYRRAVGKIYGKTRKRHQRAVGPEHIPMRTLRWTENM
ncbi:adenosine receptor A2b-like [Branchiostoma lanceolatum]|uniref:adenosine receptor A2b-like n=1 Tax=Branchiostoma lanceolatum TaxID=7740 RepID=UPI00345162DB